MPALHTPIVWITLVPLAAAAVSVPGEGTAVVVTFDEGRNIGNWSFFGDPKNPIEVIERTGGNPGAFLHSTCSGLACLDTFAPQFRTQLGVQSVFLGDYRKKGVDFLGIDVAIFGPRFVSTGSRPLTLLLIDDAGTEAPSDDSAVFLKGPNIPRPEGQWCSYGFDVPSQSTVLPPGWLVLVAPGTPDEAWNNVITGVDQAVFYFGDPELFYIFQQWEIGVDNIRIERELDQL